MVRALLEGRKSQTRRIIKPLTKRHPLVNLKEHAVGEHKEHYSGRFDDPMSWGFVCADDGADMLLGQWLNLCPYGQPGDLLWVRETFKPIHSGDPSRGAEYRAERVKDDISWKPGIHMPRWASRLTLRITEIRVQRLKDIDGLDALAEGIDREFETAPWRTYLKLWNSIHGEGAWQQNPWVWAITFEVIKANVDQVLAQKVAA